MHSTQNPIKGLACVPAVSLPLGPPRIKVAKKMRPAAHVARRMKFVFSLKLLRLVFYIFPVGAKAPPRLLLHFPGELRLFAQNSEHYSSVKFFINIRRTIGTETTSLAANPKNVFEKKLFDVMIFRTTSVFFKILAPIWCRSCV